jgi:CheY-like chemotaxis protein
MTPRPKQPLRSPEPATAPTTEPATPAAKRLNLSDSATTTGTAATGPADRIAAADHDLPMRIRSALLGQTTFGGGETTVTSASAPARQAQPSPPRRARILIADDERRIRLALRSCLEAEGYHVLEAADGIEAMASIIRFAPDLMILDLAMPTLDGMRTLHKLQGVHGQLKPRVIVLTAFGSGPAMLKAIGLGASMFLEKPTDPETLRRAVTQVLSQAPPEEDESAGVPIDWSEEMHRGDDEGDEIQ